MDILGQSYFDNPLRQWLIAGGVFVAVLFGLLVLRRLIVGRLKAFAARTATLWDDLLLVELQKTRLILLISVAVFAGSLVLVLPPAVRAGIDKVFLMIVLLQAAAWGNALIGQAIGQAARQKVAKDAAQATMMAAMGFLIKLALWTVVLLVALDNLGFNITALIAGLGVGGIAVALGLQSIVGDLFASLSIVLDKPFVIGDFIIVDQYQGTVERIGLKTTRIRSLSGEQIVFSNSDLLGSRIGNYQRMQERRIAFSVGVAYQTPRRKLEDIPVIIQEIIARQELVRFDRAHFKEFGESSLNFEVVYYVKSPDYAVYMETQQRINLELYQQFADEGIEFAYPTRRIFVRHEGGLESPAAVPGEAPTGPRPG